MKPTQDQLTEIKKNKTLDKIKCYDQNKKKVINFENWLKSKVTIWLKATDCEFSSDRIKWETLEIRGHTIYVNSWSKYHYIPLEFLWDESLIEQKKQEMIMRKTYQEQRAELKERELYEKLHAKYGSEV